MIQMKASEYGEYLEDPVDTQILFNPFLAFSFDVAPPQPQLLGHYSLHP